MSQCWDDRKLDSYEGWVDAVRASVFLAVQLYEHKEGIRPSERPEAELLDELRPAERLRGRGFERIRLLGGDHAVEAEHRLNTAVLAFDWQPEGKTSGRLKG